MSPEEKILITLLKAGNRIAFEKPYNFALRITNSKEDAEGIV